MKKIGRSKLICALSTLDARQLTRFLQFVRSPFFNSHQPTLDLAEYLADQRRRWDRITKEELSEKLFPGQPHEEFRVSNTMSYLMDLFDRFLIQTGMEGQPETDLYGLEAAMDLGLVSLFRQNMAGTRKRTEGMPVKDDKYYWMKFRLQLADHDYQFGLETDFHISTLQESLTALDVWYFKIRLERTCELFAIQEMKRQRETVPFLERHFDFIRKNLAYFEAFPVVILYYKCLLMVRENEELKHYFDLSAYFSKHEFNLNTHDRTTIYRHLLNYTIRKTNSNDPFFERESLNVYKKLIDNGLIFRGGKIQQSEYNNIISLSCNFQEYEWARDFAGKYVAFLPEDVRENAGNFNMANIYFHEKRYDESLELIGQVAFTNIFYQIKVRFLQIKIYFEQGEDSLLQSALDSFRIFNLRNKKMPAFHRKGGLNFVRFARVLVNLESLSRAGGDRSLRTKARQLVARLVAYDEPLINKPWLLEKSEALLK